MSNRMKKMIKILLDETVEVTIFGIPCSRKTNYPSNATLVVVPDVRIFTRLYRRRVLNTSWNR